MTRILVVDDPPLVREVIADLLSETEDLLVIGQCSDGSEVADAAAALRPEVVVMDVSMPAVSGVEATRRLRDAQPDVRVLLLSGQSHPRSREDARRAGAAGYCDKSGRAEDLLQAVRNVAAGGTAHQDGAHVWAACLAVLFTVLTVVAAELFRRAAPSPRGVASSLRWRVWLLRPRPPDPFALCVLRI